MKAKSWAGLIVSFFMVSSASFAHHSGTWADNEHPITLTGTVTEFITFEDPNAYTKPFSAKRNYRLAPPDWEVEEVVLCEDKLLGNPVPIR